MTPEREHPAGAAGDSDAAVDSDRTPLDWPRDTGHLTRVMAAIAVRKKHQRRRRVRAAIGGVAALLIAGWVWFPPRSDSRAVIAAAATSRAIVSSPERRTLPDGSIVELRDGSEIAVDFGGPLRRVTLRQGEVHFQVAKDPDRAFVVAAGGMEFRAVGTAFSVQLRSAEVEMLVTEGRVAVERAPAAGVEQIRGASDRLPLAPLTIVEAGHRVAVDLPASTVIAPPQVRPLSSAESAAKLAWRVPRLDLTDTPLAAAVAEINQHSAVRLELGDIELGKVEISGVLRADNIEPLLRMLENSYGIRADRHEPGKIVLRKDR